MSIKKTQRVAVACTNANGEADLVIVDVDITSEEYDLGVHYDLAKDKVESQGYEQPFVCFDASEQRNIKRAFEFKFSNEDDATGDLKTSLVIAALRHFQRAVEAGQDLSYLEDIIDMDDVAKIDIDNLCEDINQ